MTFIKFHGKCLALDIGTAWTGIAISDPLGILARPLTAIKADTIQTFLVDLFKKESIGTIIVGYPRTMEGSESAQTRSVLLQFEQLRTCFPEKKWLLWDERLSTQRASRLGSRHTKEGRLKEQARAATFILDLYLEHILQQKEGSSNSD